MCRLFLMQIDSFVDANKKTYVLTCRQQLPWRLGDARRMAAKPKQVDPRCSSEAVTRCCTREQRCYHTQHRLSTLKSPGFLFRSCQQSRMSIILRVILTTVESFKKEKKNFMKKAVGWVCCRHTGGR